MVSVGIFPVFFIDIRLVPVDEVTVIITRVFKTCETNEDRGTSDCIDPVRTPAALKGITLCADY